MVPITTNSKIRSRTAIFMPLSLLSVGQENGCTTTKARDREAMQLSETPINTPVFFFLIKFFSVNQRICNVTNLSALDVCLVTRSILPPLSSRRTLSYKSGYCMQGEVVEGHNVSISRTSVAPDNSTNAKNGKRFRRVLFKLCS